MKEVDQGEVLSVPEDYFKYVNMSLPLGGIDLKKRFTGTYYKFYIAFAMFLVLAYLPILAYEVMSNVNRFDNLIMIFTFALSYLMGVVKIVLLFNNKDSVATLMTKIQTGVFAPNLKRGGPKEFIWINGLIKRLDIQAITYLSLGCVVIIPFVGWSIYKRLALPNDEWQFPLFPTFTDYFKQSPSYELTLLLQFLTLTYLSFTVIPADILLVNFMAHVSLQFQILQAYIIKTIKRIVCLQSENRWDEIDEAIVDIVEHHDELYSIAQEIETTYNKLCLTMVIGNGVALCLALYRISYMEIEVLLQLVPYYIILLIQLSLPCYWGNEVTIQSQKVAQIIFESEWYCTDVQVQKSLLRMIQRAQKPIVFTAGKVTDLSLENFMTIVRTSYSCFTLLTNQRA